ncbi:glycosyltransferase family 25 protein [bacterium]|nr:glycosyltransferase family 25 protein [bacterium]
MEGGIHVYCINLKHRTDRWDRFSNQSELQTLMKHYTFERYEGINGSAIDLMKDDRISLRTKRNVREHVRRDHEELDSAGGVGCYLSHTNVWKKFLERSEEYAIILEDDAVLYNGFVEDLQHAMKDTTLLPQAPDVWFFNRPTDWYYEYKGKTNPKQIKENNLGPWTTNTCAPFTGYMLRKQAAEKLLETAFPLDMHVDLYTCLAGDLGHIFTVSHRDIVLKDYRLKDIDSDIRAESIGDCKICNVPTKYEKNGILMMNIPIFLIGLGSIAILYYLGLKRR